MTKLNLGTGFVVMDGKALNKAITVVGSVLGKVDGRVHELAIHGLFHANVHGDTGYIQRLVEQCAGGNIATLKSRGSVGKRGYFWRGLKMWVEMFSPIRWNDEGVAKLQKKDVPNYTPFDIEKANENPFWTVIEQKEPKALDLEAILKSLAGYTKKIETAHENGRYTDDYAASLEAMGKVHAYARKVFRPIMVGVKGDEPTSATQADGEPTTRLIAMGKAA